MKIKISALTLKTFFKSSLVELSMVPTDTKVSYNIVKTLKSVNSELEIIETTRENILDKFGTKNLSEKKYIFESPEKEKQAIEGVNELYKTEIELDIFPIQKSNIMDYKIPAAILMNLEKFILED